MKTMEEPSSDVLQRLVYNKDVGGKLNQSETYSGPAGTAWAIFGTVVDDTTVVGNIPTLKAAIEALSNVQTADAMFWGRQPALDAGNVDDWETVLHTSGVLTQTVALGGAKNFQQVSRFYRPRKIPAGKKWIVWAFKVPSVLDQAAIASLVSALEGVTGIDQAEPLFDGVIDSDATAGGTLTIACHIRIDRKPEEP